MLFAGSPPLCFLVASLLSIFLLLSESANAKPTFLTFRGGGGEKKTTFAPPKLATTPTTTTTTATSPIHSTVGIIIVSGENNNSNNNINNINNNNNNNNNNDAINYLPAAWVSDDNKNNNDDDTTKTSVILLDDNQRAVSRVTNNNLPSKNDKKDDIIMANTMVLLCDIVILVLPPDTTTSTSTTTAVDPKLVASLVEGAKKRMETSLLGKGRLILVTPPGVVGKDEDVKEQDDSARMEDLVQRQFADIVPSEWEAFDIITSSKKINKSPILLQNLVEELLVDATGRSVINAIFSNEKEEENALLFVKLFHQVYQQQCSDSMKMMMMMSSLPPFEVQPIIPPLPGELTEDTTAPIATNNRETTLKLDDGNFNNNGKTASDDTNVDSTTRIQEILIRCRTQLESIESKLQDVLLSDTRNQMPLLEFGTLADELLDQTYTELKDFFPSIGERRGVLTPVVTELHRLYKDQLQTLRDYYGKRYEHILEESNGDDDDEGEWTSAAERMMQGFQAAATNSVPTLCQPNEALAGIAPFLEPNAALQGLITDMLEATQIRKDEQSLAMEIVDDDDDEDGEVPGRFHRVPRWLKKLAGRALVLGVNYIQGWLAWQGVRRAASERDRSMPKFPLF